MSRFLHPFICTICIVALSGCCTPRKCITPSEDLERMFAANPQEYQSTAEERLAMKPDREKAYQVLVLSGGGANGAWGAGFLNGWSSSGNRPNFDVVTGVSTGALIATGAFLGDDDMLRDAYTTTSTAEVHTDRPLITIPFSDSLKDTKPLRNLIHKYISDDRVKLVAEAAAKKRKLFVASVDLDSGKLIMWDLTRIAQANRPDLYRQVVLASASAPVLYPPVIIGDRLHADGGVRASLFLRNYLLPTIKKVQEKRGRPTRATAGAEAAPPTTAPSDPSVYIIYNGRLGLGQTCVDECLVPVVLRTLQCLLDANAFNSVLEAKRAASDLMYQVHFSAIPDSVSPVSSFEFVPADMTKLFQSAFDYGQRIDWQEIPDPDKLQGNMAAY